MCVCVCVCVCECIGKDIMHPEVGTKTPPTTPCSHHKSLQGSVLTDTENENAVTDCEKSLQQIPDQRVIPASVEGSSKLVMAR